MSIRSYPVRSSVFWLLRDEIQSDRQKRLDFHVQFGDCFNDLARKISLAEDDLQSSRDQGSKPTKEVIELLHHLHQDLDYLQSQYQIERKLPTGR